METKHIVVTTDLSDEAQRAFEPATNLALGVGASVTLLHVVPVVTDVAGDAGAALPVVPPGYESIAESALAALDAQAASLPDELDVSCRVVTGTNVAKAIVRYAEEHDAGLIAMSTHGRSGLRRVVLGSVAEGVLRHAHVPVLCFPPPEDGAGGDEDPER